MKTIGKCESCGKFPAFDFYNGHFLEKVKLLCDDCQAMAASNLIGAILEVDEDNAKADRIDEGDSVEGLVERLSECRNKQKQYFR